MGVISMFTRLLAILAVLLGAAPAIASPQVTAGKSPASSQNITVVFKASDTADSEAIPVSGFCSVRYQQASGDDASLYAVTTATTAATSGTLIAAFTSSTTTATTFTAGTRWVKAVATDATAGGSVMTIDCAPLTGGGGSGGGAGGSGIVGWPSFESIGGTGRPTQAIVIDSLAYSTKLSGSGRDDDGGTWDGSCTANATTDQPCTRDTDTIAGLSISIDGAGTALSANSIDITASDPQLSLYCRDSGTFAHQVGTANDTSIAADGDYIAAVLRDDTDDTYRLVSTYGAALNCVTPSGNISLGGVTAYGTATADDLMPFIMDAVHLSPYGSRWTAQEVLTAAWEDMYPEMLGVDNLITNGYMETTCSAGSPLTATGGGGWAARAAPTVTALNRAIIGQGCEFTVAADTDTRSAATAVIDAEPGAYYVGSVALASGGAGTTRSAILRIRDQAGTNIPNAAFWLGGQPSGVSAAPVATIDPTGVATPGEYQIQENMIYGGGIVKFAFQVPAGATGFDIQLAQTDVATQYSLYIDELWVRKKMHADLERHYIIADGNAEIQLFTDSRGLTSRFESLQDSFDYMLGETTKSGEVRSEGSIRPNLYLDTKVSQNTYSVSGQRLGNYVGENDGFETYSGAAATVPELGSLIDNGTKYCMAYYGINDLTAGARPTASAWATPADTEANRHLYFADQLRGFEIEAEKNGCIPIVIMEPVARGDTTTTTCSDEDGGALNCATWHQLLWRDVLHNGIP